MNGNKLIQEGMLWSSPITYGLLLMAVEYFRQQLGEGNIKLELTLNPESKFTTAEEDRISKELNVVIRYDREVPSGHVWCPARSKAST